jgi:hypothetical protein
LRLLQPLFNVGAAVHHPSTELERFGAARPVEDVVVATTDDEAPKRADRCVYRGDLPGDPYGHEHTLRIWATYGAADGLTVEGSDSTQWPVDDLVYKYHVAPEHIGDLRTALGAVGDEDLLELLAQRYEDGTMPTPYLSEWLTEHGVAYSASRTLYPN